MCVYLRETASNQAVWIVDLVTDKEEFVWMKERGSNTFYLEILSPGGIEKNMPFMSPISSQDWDKFISEDDEFLDNCMDYKTPLRKWTKAVVMSGNWYDLNEAITKVENDDDGQLP